MIEALPLVPQIFGEHNSTPPTLAESDEKVPQILAKPFELVRYTFRQAARDISAAWHRRESRRPDRFKDIGRYVAAVAAGLLETEGPDPRAHILAAMNDEQLRAEILRLRDSIDLDEVMTVRECVPVPSERFREKYLPSQSEGNSTPPCEVEVDEEDDVDEV